MLELTGEELVLLKETHHPLTAGLVEGPDGYRLNTGSPVDSDETYSGIDRRDPSLALLRRLATDRLHPLDEALAVAP